MLFFCSSYAVNGNLTTDKNKGVNQIRYNHLNMPVAISATNDLTYGFISYKYDANGSKLEKNLSDYGNNSYITTQYAGNYVYENNSLKQISHPEGYIESDGNGGYQYVYYLKDIWGNTRITYADNDKDGKIDLVRNNIDVDGDGDLAHEIRREQNFYPFGLEHKGYNNTLRGVKNNLKTYQGQEFTEDLGLNTHEWRYRISDPAIGRFWQIDPLAEDYVYNSTYAFQENKMGMGTELEGLELNPFNSPTSTQSFTRDQRKYPEQDRAAMATAAVIMAAEIGIAVAGVKASLGFVANEIKDEALSQATGGASDVIDASKAVTKVVKAGAEMITKKVGKGADFVVTPDGTSVPNSSSELKKSLDSAGIPGTPTTATKEVGTVYTVPTENQSSGYFTIRVMDGKANGGQYGGPRAVTTQSNNGQYVQSNGANPANGTSKSERKELGHTHLDNQ